MRNYVNEKNVQKAFEVSLFLKAAFAIAEIMGAIAAYFVTNQYLIRMVGLLTGHELAEDPRDVLANYLRHAAQAFSGSTQHFAAYYLLGHGVVKLWLIIGLLRKRLWYYPAAVATFGLFAGYQLYRFSFTHSLFLMLITALDLVVMVLTWHEFNFLRSRLEKQTSTS